MCVILTLGRRDMAGKEIVMESQRETFCYYEDEAVRV